MIFPARQRRRRRRDAQITLRERASLIQFPMSAPSSLRDE